MNLTMMTDTGIVTRAIIAISGEMSSIIKTTPIIDNSDESSWLKLCCMLCETLSMSLVTRLSKSPRGAWST